MVPGRMGPDLRGKIDQDLCFPGIVDFDLGAGENSQTRGESTLD